MAVPRQRREEKGPGAIIRDDRVALFIQTAGYSHIRPLLSLVAPLNEAPLQPDAVPSHPYCPSSYSWSGHASLLSELDLILQHSPSRADLYMLYIWSYLFGGKRRRDCWGVPTFPTCTQYQRAVALWMGQKVLVGEQRMRKRIRGRECLAFR